MTGISPGKPVLQATVPKLIDRPDCAQNIPLACVVEKSH